ncbi:MAG: HlyD family secretion protein [Alphaproteobacteria bacterium]|jgi:membrane fusion protein, multidrug efflux system|nr:MAG: HlyD family secretion protein [Alphaproteobacteria bacterium]
MSAQTAEALRPVSSPAPGTPAPEAAKRSRLPFSRRTLIAVGIALAAAIGGAVYILLPHGSVTTDAAYLEADSSIVSPRIRGIVSEILVQDNTIVKVGTPLLRIDDAEFAAREASAEADLRTAEAAVLAARAAFSELSAQQRLANSDVTAARAAIVSAEAEAARTVADKARFDRLADAGAASRRDVDQTSAAAASANAEVARLTAKLDVSRSQSAAVTARHETLIAALAEAQASEARAKAALDLARQDSSYTLVKAPVDGVIGDRKANVGDYVQPGTRLMTVVPLDALYVVANFKETQVARMLPGQSATIEADALPGVKLHGKVESFAPGSGSQFSLLPFEPGTGNFTKIVQRVPVRIALDRDQTDVKRLRPGLSTVVTVNLNDH